MFGYTVERTTGHVIGYWVADEKPVDDFGYTYHACEESEKPLVYKPPVLVPYNSSELLTWCLSVPMQAASFIALPDTVRVLAISFTQRFADNIGVASSSANAAVVLYRLAADGLGLRPMAEMVITYAKSLNAPITID